MTTFRAYPFETLLIGATILLTAGGFWRIYLGPGSDASGYHHLHIATLLVWLALLACQLALAANTRYSAHRSIGLTVLITAPLLVASVALLSVESAREGVASGRGDFMIVQNVMGTLQLGLIIFLGFALRKNRQLHAAFLVSTALLFLGIALFFCLTGFVPGFRIEGPETFYRFGKALTTIQVASVAIGLTFFFKRPKHGWPYLLVGATFFLNEQIKSLLASNEWISPLTEFVGSIHQPLAFVGSFVVVLLLLACTGVHKPGSRLEASRTAGRRSA